jgi:hypothetical protein
MFWTLIFKDIWTVKIYSQVLARVFLCKDWQGCGTSSGGCACTYPAEQRTPACSVACRRQRGSTRLASCWQTAMRRQFNEYTVLAVWYKTVPLFDAGGGSPTGVIRRDKHTVQDIITGGSTRIRKCIRPEAAPLPRCTDLSSTSRARGQQRFTCASMARTTELATKLASGILAVPACHALIQALCRWRST